MKYVIDTNVLRKMLDHLPHKGLVFKTVWDNIERNILNETVVSVDECMNEMKKHFSKDSDNSKWIDDHKYMFLYPTNDESITISKIFKNKKMQESIHQKNILLNRPSADVYIAAKAKTLEATVVTSEEYKPNSAQLPNICEMIGVKCISYDDFMAIITEYEYE
ncbi:MAG: DUF4411 family protein [Oscillospiraceae bacterium]|nr:DUF4411 family protein [Oscillospiraceae bacterium]